MEFKYLIKRVHTEEGENKILHTYTDIYFGNNLEKIRSDMLNTMMCGRVTKIDFRIGSELDKNWFKEDVVLYGISEAVLDDSHIKCTTKITVHEMYDGFMLSEHTTEKVK